jgi:hypothetical protein
MAASEMGRRIELGNAAEAEDDRINAGDWFGCP